MVFSVKIMKRIIIFKSKSKLKFCGDKGISVGQGSTVNIEKNLIEVELKSLSAKRPNI